jgi:small conductance mechanosensitive channel
MIELPAEWPSFVRVGLAFGVALVAFPLAGLAARGVRSAAQKTARVNAVDTTIITFGAELARIGFLIGALILVLTLAGVQSSSVAAVLGAATLAIGLALQATLSNVAAGVLIFIFAPYRVGESVEIMDRQGRVKLLSLFTTELESAQGCSIVLSNARIMLQPITNFTRNGKRRVDLDIILNWETDTTVAVKVAADTFSTLKKVTKAPVPTAVISALTDKGPVLSVRIWTTPQDSLELGFEAAGKLHAALRDAGIKGVAV